MLTVLLDWFSFALSVNWSTSEWRPELSSGVTAEVGIPVLVTECLVWNLCLVFDNRDADGGERKVFKGFPLWWTDRRSLRIFWDIDRAKCVWKEKRNMSVIWHSKHHAGWSISLLLSGKLKKTLSFYALL